MKKWIIFVGIIPALLFGFLHVRNARKQYLKTETYIKFLKKEVYLSKLHSPIRGWMKEQIEDDFSEYQSKGFGLKQVEATYAQVKRYSPMFVRYRIINKQLYRYFPDGESISLQDNTTERAIKTILQCTSLPDMDFVISYFDGITLQDRYFDDLTADLQAPVFFPAKVEGVPHVVLIPDWRSIGEWWISDIKSIQKRVGLFSWNQKKNFALWRGSLTKPIRRKLCELSLHYPEYLDAKFFNLEYPKEEDLQYLGDRVSWEEFLECKYLPLMDGVVCAAPAFQWRLLSYSVIFKHDSNEIQWFYRPLKPYLHYVPVKADLSNLIEQFNWAKEHDNECKEMAEKAALFAKENLMYEDVLEYFTRVLLRYSSLQKNQDPIIVGNGWVNIQKRESMRVKAKKENFKGYTIHPTPY